jgi:ABC-type transport system involved in multi-copper enzyme maturation permease subunit
VSQTGVVARLALRELWITFRLLLLLAGFVGIGAAIALLPAALPSVMQRLGIGLGVASTIAAMIAAWSFAEDRARGRAGWLVTRSVSRSTLLAGWFVALAALVLVGVGVAGVLGWLTASGVSLRLDPATFALGVLGVAATALLAVALGMLIGTVAPTRPAIAGTLVLTLALGSVAWLGPVAGELVPGGAMAQLGAVREAGTSHAALWRSTGAALVATAVVLGLARLLLERAEL